MDKILVDKNALRTVVSALIGSPHLVRELQATRNLPTDIKNPIDILREDYNLAYAWTPSATDSENAIDAKRFRALLTLFQCSDTPKLEDVTPNIKAFIEAFETCDTPPTVDMFIAAIDNVLLG